jgi:hypothetical protein
MFLSGNRHSILQESLLLVLPAEGKKIRRFSNVREGQCLNSNAAQSKMLDFRGRFGSQRDTRITGLPLKSRRWMHLEAKRLTTKYLTSKMFSLP